MSKKDELAVVYAEIARDNQRIRQQFLDTFLTLTAAEVARAATSSEGRTGMVEGWRAASRMFSVPVNGEERYPAFQFQDGEPRPVIARVIAALPHHLSSWQIAFWFVSSNSWLGGISPVSLLDADPGSVVAAAESKHDEIVG